MKQFAAKLAVLTCLALSQLTSNVALAGPGGGNGDDGGTLMLSKIKKERGLDEFHTLLYAFEHGSPLNFPSSWVINGFMVRYFRNGEIQVTDERNSGTDLTLGVDDRGPFLDSEWFVFSALLGSNNTDIEFKNGSMVIASLNREYRVYNNTLFQIERPGSDGRCRVGAIKPVKGICEIRYLTRTR